MGQRSRAGSPTDCGVTPNRSRATAASASTPINGRTPAMGRSKSSLAGTPVGPLPTFSRTRASRAGQSRSEPASPRASRPSSLADDSASLADLLADEDGSRTADNVRVLVRIRPLNQHEQQDGDGHGCVTANGQAVMLADPSRGEPFVKVRGGKWCSRRYS